MNWVASCDKWPLVTARKGLSYDTVLAVKSWQHLAANLGFECCDEWPLITDRPEVSYDTLRTVNHFKIWSQMV